MKKIKITAQTDLFNIACYIGIVYFTAMQSMHNELTTQQKHWDWNTLSWYNPAKNTGTWQNLDTKKQEKLFEFFKQIYYPFFVSQGEQDWGIIIDNNGILQSIENRQAYAVWHAAKNMAQVNKQLYTSFKIHYLAFIDAMYKSNHRVTYGYTLDRYLLESASHDPLLLDLFLYRAIVENRNSNTMHLDDDHVFQSSCIEHNIALYKPSSQDATLAKKIIFFANRIRFFTDDNTIYSLINETNLLTKPFITECIKGGYLPIQTQYFSTCTKSKHTFCSTLILLPLHVIYSVSSEGKLIKNFALPLAYNSHLKVENNQLHAECDSLIFKNQLLKERLDLIVPLLSGLKYFNDSVRQMLAKLAAYPRQKSIEAKNTEKHLREEIKTLEQNHKITRKRFAILLNEKENTIDQLKKDCIRKDNKIESDSKIIKFYVNANLQLFKEKKELQLKLKSYELQIQTLKTKLDQLQIALATANSNHEQAIIATKKVEAALKQKEDELENSKNTINLLQNTNKNQATQLKEMETNNLTANQKITEQDLQIQKITNEKEQLVKDNTIATNNLINKHTILKQKLYYIIAGSVLLNIVLLFGIYQYTYFLKHA